MPDSPIEAMHGLLRTGQLDKKENNRDCFK